MIWVITTKTDKEFYVSERNKNFIKEALGEENVSFIEVTEDTILDFLSPADTVLCQTRNKNVLRNICKRGAKNTAEDAFTILYTQNKLAVKILLEKDGIPYPRTTKSLGKGKPLFVKPMYGEDSNGICEKSLCRTNEELEVRIEELHKQGQYSLVEEFVEGTEATVAVFRDSTGDIKAYPLEVSLTTPNNILTHEAKMSENEICRVSENKDLVEFAKKAFKTVGCKHYMRIDFRIAKDGTPYLIDFNLFPGLGPIDHFAKCLTLCANMSYRDILNTILSTATTKDYV